MGKNSTGIFICHCGDNIKDTVDIGRIKNAILREEVSCVEDHPYLCSVHGQELIKSKIEDLNLNNVVVAACSPKLHEKKFQKSMESVGINKHLLEVANIREQAAWVRKDKDPTRRALANVHSALKAVKVAVPLESKKTSVKKSVVIIGGGISGITAALSLAKQNIKVHLIEKSPTIGGNMVKIGKVFSSEDLSEECAMCSLAPLMGEVAENENITLLTLSQVTEVQGMVGDFHIKVSTGPVKVDMEKCTSCGKCAQVCKVSVEDEWNANMSKHPAIYRPFAQAVPSVYTIDTQSCTKCGLCVRECSSGAIDLERGSKTQVINAGSIIIATGHEEMNPSDKDELGYGKLPGVITQMELARILAVNGPTSGDLKDPATGITPRRIVMIQCVGSRDRKPGNIPHCSTICCMTALKHASYITNHFGGVEIFICYTDMRTIGTYENYYFETQKRGEKNLRFIRGRVGDVRNYNDSLMVRVEDTLGGGLMDIETDMVILSCALEPAKNIENLESILKITLTPEMFVKEKNPKLEPTQTTVPGIFVCGTAKEAMDITDSIKMSRSAVSQVGELLGSGEIVWEPDFAEINLEKCDICGDCLKCPADAVTINKNVYIDPKTCTGCGYCINLCDKKAISLPTCSDESIMAHIEGALNEADGSEILAFLDEAISYVAADNAGMNNVEYPAEIRIIKVPSILRLNTNHLKFAFKKGVRGIFLADGAGNARGQKFSQRLTEKVEELKEGLESEGINSERITFYEAYLPHFKGLANKFKEFSKKLN